METYFAVSATIINPAINAIVMLSGISPNRRFPLFSASKNIIVDAIAGACSNFVNVKIKLARNTISPNTAGAKIIAGMNVIVFKNIGAVAAKINATEWDPMTTQTLCPCCSIIRTNKLAAKVGIINGASRIIAMMLMANIVIARIGVLAISPK